MSVISGFADVDGRLAGRMVGVPHAPDALSLATGTFGAGQGLAGGH